jgi:hypothetical protein
MPERPTEYAAQSADGQLLTGRHIDPITAWEEYAASGKSVKDHPGGSGVIVVRFLTRVDEPTAPDVLVYSDIDGSPHLSYRAPDQVIYYHAANGSTPRERTPWFVLAGFNPRVHVGTALEVTARYDPTLSQPTDSAAVELLRRMLREGQEQNRQIIAALRRHDRPTELSPHAVFIRRASDILTTSPDPKAGLRALLNEPDSR